MNENFLVWIAFDDLQKLRERFVRGKRTVPGNRHILHSQLVHRSFLIVVGSATHINDNRHANLLEAFKPVYSRLPSAEEIRRDLTKVWETYPILSAAHRLLRRRCSFLAVTL